VAAAAAVVLATGFTSVAMRLQPACWAAALGGRGTIAGRGSRTLLAARSMAVAGTAGVGHGLRGRSATNFPVSAASPPLRSAAMLLCGSFGAGFQVALMSTVALAAAGAKRRRRRVPPAQGPAAADAPAQPVVTQGGKKLDGIAADLATNLKVSDADRNRRQRKKRAEAMRKMREEEEKEEDPIENLLKGEDPDFFGAPYIWIQLGHVILLATAVIAAILPYFIDDPENVVLGLEGAPLTALRTGLTFVFGTNIGVAAWLYFEETSLTGDVVAALGWAVKALLLGGVASWQRFGRIAKAKAPKKKLDDEEGRGVSLF